MGKRRHVIRNGRHKGRTIEFASTAGVESVRDLADMFMSDIFDLEPGDYLITDESRLSDFVGVDDLELKDILTRIEDLYGVDVSDVEHGNLLQIFGRIHGKA